MSQGSVQGSVQDGSSTAGALCGCSPWLQGLIPLSPNLHYYRFSQGLLGPQNDTLLSMLISDSSALQDEARDPHDHLDQCGPQGRHSTGVPRACSGVKQPLSSYITLLILRLIISKWEQHLPGQCQ